MRDLLAFCGYETSEIESELSRIQKAFTRLSITENDIETGKQRVQTYYDMELKGIRKLLGCYLRECVNIVLAKEEGKKKIVHGCMAPGFDIIGGAINSHFPDAFTMVPNPMFMVVLGCIFGKFVPILEAAERLWLKTGMVAHCAMVKSRLGLLSLGLIPKPDFLVTSGSTCETSPKTNDLLQETEGIRSLCYDSCRDIDPSEYPVQTRAIIFAAESMRRLTRVLEDNMGIKLEGDMLQEMLDAKSAYGKALGRIHKLIHTSDPVPIGSTHGNLLAWLGGAALTIDDTRKATAAFNTLYEELEERVHKGEGVLEKGAPRVLGILPFHHSDPSLECLMNTLGIAQIASDYDFPVPGSTPPDFNADSDPFVAIAQGTHSSPLAFNLSGRIEIIKKACRELNVDGVLNHYHVGCRYVAGDAMSIQRALTKELDIPVLELEWENFDPRVFDHDHFRSQLEMFKTIMKNKQG